MLQVRVLLIYSKKSFRLNFTTVHTPMEITYYVIVVTLPLPLPMGIIATFESCNFILNGLIAVRVLTRVNMLACVCVGGGGWG